MSQGNGSNRDYGTNGPPVPDVGFADFSPTEMYNLSENIAENITVINSGWKSLNKTLKLIGTPKDNQTLRDKAHDIQQNVNASVNATTKDICRLTVVVRRGDKRQKLQLERLTQSFREALGKYSATQKQLAEKMQKHMPMKQMTEYPQEGTPDVDDDTARLVAQKQEQARKLEFETAMLEEREAYCRNIEADVLDVHQIMTELGALVYAQGSTVDTIESNIETGAAHIEQGTEELVKAARYQAKFRRKMLILLVIAIIVGIILTIILVNTLKR